MNLTVILQPGTQEIVSRGIVNDVTVFRDVRFANARELARYAARHWHTKYREVNYLWSLKKENA
jgi:hypothetical protein